MVFNNTVQAFRKILNDVKKIYNIIRKFIFFSTIVIQLFFIAYHTISLALGQGIIFVHSLLLSFLVAHLIVFVATYDRKISRIVKKKIKLTFKVSKYIINITSITISLIWLATGESEITIFTLLPLITLVTSVFILLIGDLLAYTYTRYMRMLKEAFLADTVIPIKNSIGTTISNTKEGIDKVKEFYVGNKETIKSLTGNVINAFSSFRKSGKNSSIQYEDKTETDYSNTEN